MLVCQACGGANVAVLNWVDANDGSLIEEAIAPTRCWDCSDECTLVTAEDYAQRGARLEAEMRCDIARDER